MSRAMPEAAAVRWGEAAADLSEGLLALLRRVSPMAHALARHLRMIALCAGLGATVLWIVFLDMLRPLVSLEVLFLAISLFAVLAPPWMLLRCCLTLNNIAALPSQLANMPELARNHAEKLAQIVEDVQTANRTGLLASLSGIPRAVRTLIGSRQLVQAWDPLVSVMELQFFGSLLIALALCLAEILLGSLVAIWLILLR